MQERVLDLLKIVTVPMTATQIFQTLKSTDGTMKLASLSSLLKKMYDTGELSRLSRFGPRGGFGYEVKR